MNFTKDNMRLYAITDRKWLDGRNLADDAELALKGGATLIQLREKDLSYKDFLKEALSVKTVCSKYNIPLIINDNIDVMIESGADGIHLGQSDLVSANIKEKIGKDKILGISAHTIKEALLAEKAGADYLGVGAVFTTSTKLDANNVSMETLKEICCSVKIPVVAIGGISKDNMLDLKDSGIAGVSIISGIFAENDIEKATKNLLNLTKEII